MPKKEWIGESGYSNCLLVSMSRMKIGRIILYSDKLLPDLNKLTLSREDTNRWIRAQEFEYSMLDPLTVIRILAESAGISPESSNFSGSIEVYDVVGDDGPTIEREFKMDLGVDGDSIVLKIIQKGIEEAEPGHSL